MELMKFIELFCPCGDAYVVYWTEDSEKFDDAPLWKGDILETPFWIVKEYNIGRYDDEWDAVVDMRRNLGEEYNGQPGLVITLVPKERKDS